MKVLELVKNGDPLGLVFSFILFAADIAIFVYFVVKSKKIFTDYVFDGGDASIPCLFSILLVLIFALVITTICTLTGVFKSEQSLIINLLYSTIVAMSLRGRILGYPSIKISMLKRSALLFLAGLCIDVIIIVSIAFYDSSFVGNLTGYTMLELSDEMLSVLSSTRTPGLLIPLTFFFCTLIMELGILYFDIKEKRNIRTIQKTFILMAGTFIFLFFGLVDVPNTPFVAIPYLFIIWIIFSHFRFEVNKVIKRAEKPNTVADGLRKCIRSLIRRKSYCDNDISRIKYVLKLFEEDEETAEAVISSFVASINSKSRHFAVLLKLCHKNPEKIDNIKIMLEEVNSGNVPS
jgi:hypothetical protein